MVYIIMKLFQAKSIKTTVMFVNLAIVLPLVILFFVLLVSVSQNATNTNNETKLQALEGKVQSILSTNTEVIKMMAAFTLDSDIHKILSKTSYESAFQLLQDRRVIAAKSLSLTSMYANDWYQIMVFGENGENFFESSVAMDREQTTFEELKQEDWYQTLADDDNQTVFFPAYQSKILSENLPDKAVFAAVPLKNQNSGRVIALVVVAMTEEMFVEDLLQFNITTENGFMTNQNGEIIFASNLDIYQLDQEITTSFSQAFEQKTGYFTKYVDGVQYEVRFATVDNIGWKVFSYNQKEYVWTEYIIVTIILGLVLFFVIVIMVQYNCTFIYRKMRGINDHILEVAKGDLGVRLEIDEYESEFQEVCVNFNNMLDAVQVLVQKLNEEEKKKYVLEFQTLQAQINPHFLYNTLATIRFMVQMEQYEDADYAMLTFSKLLRKSFRDNRTIISIEEELNLVGDYMSLMQIRHQNTFQWDISIDPSIEECGILKNTIQPLVENSISHGFNGKEAMGHISIQAQDRGDGIEIQIQDDGVNADIVKIQQQLSTGISEKNRNQFTSIGVSNVHQRIKRNFGEEYGLVAEVNCRGGITFVAKFPKTEVGS